MAMSLVQANADETVLPFLPTDPTDTSVVIPQSLGSMVVPSFHRPALLHYWAQHPNFSVANQELYTGTSRAFLRKVMMRPSWHDHPSFTGSNPDFANTTNDYQRMLRMIYGPWDVDNDLDGVRDSVWIDAGLPVMENSDGRLVKPLVSMLVVDMDGRLNLNAHGSEDIANRVGNQPLNVTMAGGVISPRLPNGTGYGPAEISLDPIMPGTTDAERWEWYRRVFRGVAANEMRVANDAFPVANLALRDFLRNRIGKFGGNDIVPGRPELDILTQLEMQDVPAGTAGRASTQNASGIFPLAGYGTLPDFRGRYTLGLNELGQPTNDAYALEATGTNFVFDNETIAADNPYELDLSLGAARGETELAPDGPYTVAELERILRPYDADAGSLPSRIWEFAGEFMDSSSHTVPNLDRLNQWRTTVTTDSYDLPVPTVVLPEWMYVGPDGEPGVAGQNDDGGSRTDDTSELGWFGSDDFQAVMNPATFSRQSTFPATQLTFADLLEYRIRVSDKNNDGKIETSEIWYKHQDNANPTRVTDINRAMRMLLPRELAQGLKLDINRPLGNGRDDNDNGVVDEPGEDEGAFWASTNPQLDAFAEPDADTNDGTRFTGLYRDDAVIIRVAADFNNDGLQNLTDRTSYETAVGINGSIDTLGERVFVHNLRRQDLARDLYIMAMTLVDPLPVTATNPTNQEEDARRARARRLAQWAINCVDFRDPDNIMTAFEYDENPFDGWNVDGYLRTNTNNTDIAGPDNNVGTDDDIGGIVWGAETQELVMTETLAWHDRRTTDEGEPIEESQVGNRDNAFQVVPEEAGTVYGDPDNPDIDFDQKYRPRGVCFVELYCPLAPNPAASADTHRFDNAGNDLGIDITAVDEVTGDCPVWRMSVYQRPAGLDSRECANWDPDWVHDDFRPSTQPDGGGTEVRPDRSIYFAHIDTTNPARLEAFKDMDASDGVEFFTDADMRLPIATVRPGRYLVVGSGEEQNGSGKKDRGSRVFGANIGDSENTARQRRIELRPMETTDYDGDPSDPQLNPVRLVEPANGAIREDAYQVGNEPICDVAVITSALSGRGAIDPVTRTQPNLAIKPMDRWFSITEPAGGYPGDDPNVRPTGASFYDGFPDKEGRYGNVAQPAAYDRPFDDVRVPQNQALAQPHQDGETRLRLGNLSNFQENDQLVIECYSMIYLQRLANPLLPYDKDTNPYRTVDGMSANVSLFNGSIENRKLDGLVNYGEGFLESLDTPEQRIEYRSSNAERHLASVQRGFTRSSLAGADASADLLSFELPNMPPGSRDNTFVAVRANRHPPANTQHVVNAVMDHTLGSVNYQMRQLPEPAGFDGLTPIEPFPWLTWNNRPFANANELMLVPRSSSSLMLREFSGEANDINVYAEDDVPVAPTNTRAIAGAPGAVTDRAASELAHLQQQQQGFFGHLPNMHLAERPDANKLSDVPAGFHRLLDYVHVSTPFVASETWLNPDGFGNVTAANPVNSIDDPRYDHLPPFNHVSSHREPGRINLNTITSPDVWDGGVMHRELFDPTLPWSGTNNYQFSWLRNRAQPESMTNPRIYGHTARCL